MQLKDVHLFLKAATIGNLHVAADALGMTQPALSKSIRRLETSLDTRLLERTARGVALTEVGKVFYERSIALESLVCDIRNEVNDIKHGRSAVLRIGAIPALAESVVAPMVEHFITDKEPISFDVHVQLSSDLLRNLQLGLLDFAIATTPAAEQTDFNFVSLGSIRSSVIVNMKHSLLRRKFSVADLAKERWLLPPPNTPLNNWVREMFINAEVPTSPNVAVQTHASPAIFASIVRNSRLLTVLTDDTLHSSAGAGLTSLPAPAANWSLGLALFWRRKAFFSLAMERCRTYIGETFPRRLTRRLKVEK
jgi:DNA-binding transcriptional LysR family regulator